MANLQQLLVNLEVKRGETLGSLNELFRRRAQLQEELEVVEQQIQVGRGVMDGLEQAQTVIKEEIKSVQIAEFQERKSMEYESKEQEAMSIIEKRKNEKKASGAKSSVFGDINSKTSVPGTVGFIGGGERVGQEEHK